MQKGKRTSCVYGHHRVIKSLVEQNESMTIEDSCAIRWN